MEATTGVRGTEDHGSGFSGLQETVVCGVRVQIPCKGSLIIRWKIASGGWKHEKGSEAVDVDVEDIRAGVIIPPYVEELLQGSGVGNPPVHSRDLVNVPQYWEDPWWVPPQVGHMDV